MRVGGRQGEGGWEGGEGRRGEREDGEWRPFDLLSFVCSNCVSGSSCRDQTKKKMTKKNNIFYHSFSLTRQSES